MRSTTNGSKMNVVAVACGVQKSRTYLQIALTITPREGELMSRYKIRTGSEPASTKIAKCSGKAPVLRRSWSPIFFTACLPLLFAIALAVPSPARADWLCDFNSAPGDTFHVFPNYNRPGEPPPPTFEYSFGGGVFRMSDSIPLSAGGTERGKALDSEVFSDVRVSAIINPNGETTNGYLGLVARSSVAVPGTGYWTALDADTKRLYLGKAVLGANVMRINGVIQVPNFAAPYLLQLEAINQHDYVEVAGILRDHSNGQVIDRITLQDHGTAQNPQLRSGTSGVFGGIFFQSNLNLTFGTASSVAIPEPSTAMIMVTGVLLICERRRTTQ